MQQRKKYRGGLQDHGSIDGDRIRELPKLLLGDGQYQQLFEIEAIIKAHEGRGTKVDA